MRHSQNAANFSVDDLSDLYLGYKGNKSDSLVVDFCRHFGFVSPTAAQHWSGALAGNPTEPSKNVPSASNCASSVSSRWRSSRLLPQASAKKDARGAPAGFSRARPNSWRSDRAEDVFGGFHLADTFNSQVKPRRWPSRALSNPEAILFSRLI
jgi:hypothetical protein